MVNHMKVNMLMIKSMERVNLNGQMGANILVHGVEANKMESGHIISKIMN